MDKILVTTDFSTNSKAGMRFAIQLASQHKYELTFFHACYITHPTSWNDATFEAHEKTEKEKFQMKLNQFVGLVYKSLNIVAKSIKCVIKSASSIDVDIREYAQDNDFELICISTKGAGIVRDMFGTFTSQLINHSKVPVLAVPTSYRSSEITSILYASDFDKSGNGIEESS